MTFANITFEGLLEAHPAGKRNVLRVMFVEWVQANEWFFGSQNSEYINAKNNLVLPLDIPLWKTPYYLLTGLEKALFLRFFKHCNERH